MLEKMAVYIKFALESNDESCAKMACGIISDLSDGNKAKMNEYLDDFVPCILIILRNSNVDRKIKISALQALGDLSLNCGDRFNERYLNDTMIIMNEAASMSIMAEVLSHDT